MAAWRRAIELSLGDADLENLSSIAQSRTEPASRVERARVLRGYWKDPSFFAVGQALGLHHQTVQRCVERAVVEGPMAALDDRRLPARVRAIVQRRHGAFDNSPLNAALDRLMMQSERLAHRKKRRVLPVSPQDSRPLDPARRFSSRLRYRAQVLQIRISERQLDRPSPRCHTVQSFDSKSPTAHIGSPKRQMNPMLMTTLKESVV